MVTGKVAHIGHSAEHSMPPSTQSRLSALLAKLEDKDLNCRKSSLEGIKELMQREVDQEKSMDNIAISPLIDTVLSTLDKKCKHFSMGDLGPHSQLAHSAAHLLTELAHHATHQHLRLSPHLIASIVKQLVSWLPLDVGSGSQFHSLHQACAKLVCSLADNVAAFHIHNVDSFAKSRSSACSTPSWTQTSSHDSSDLNDSSSSSSSSNVNENPSQQQIAVYMDSLCRPLMVALCSKVEPTSRGATTCLEALVSMGCWSFACPSLIEELCLRAVNVMQERTILSTSIAQLSLISNLAKKNHASLSYFRAGLLKKGADILLSNGPWQQRVAAARMIGCLLSMECHASMGSKQDKQAVTRAIESLEHCKLDKVAMVRSPVVEALKKARPPQGLEKDHVLSIPGAASTSICSTMKSSKVDYRKRRRKKPLCAPNEKESAFPSPVLVRRDPFSGNGRWTNRVTPVSGWSSSDSVDSFVDVKCPRKKVARTNAWDGKLSELPRKNRKSNVVSSSSSSTFSSSASSSVSIASPSASSSCNLADMTNRRPLSSCCCMEKTMETASHAPDVLLNSPSAESDLSNKFEKCGGIDLCGASSEEEKDVDITRDADNAKDNDACDFEENCSPFSTPTYIHHNPIAQLEILEEAEGLEVSKSDDVLSATQVGLVVSSLEHIKPQSTDVTEGMKSIDLFNEAAWNVRNNPIATDDSELDSPRPTVFESCSNSVYCAEGDDEDDDVDIQERRPEMKDDCSVHTKALEKGEGHHEGNNFAEKRQRGQVEGGDGFVDLSLRNRSHECVPAKEEIQDYGTHDVRKQQVDETLRDWTVHNFREDAYEVRATEEHGILLVCSSADDCVNQLPQQECAKEAAVEYHEASVLVPKEMVIEGREIQEETNLCHAIEWQNVSSCECVARGHCGSCQYDSSAEKCILKENEGQCTATSSSKNGGIDGSAIKDAIKSENQISNNYQEQQSYHPDNSHPLLAIYEHEGVSNNFSVLTDSNVTQQVFDGEAVMESRYDCPPRSWLTGGITHEEDMQDLKLAKDMEFLQAYPVRKSLACGDDDEPKEVDGEENGSSVLGWLSECYVVKKLGTIGTVILALAVPLAIVSIIVTFDTKEEASEFLVPT
ncbi:hypothetical protein L7F22_011357 [Adiantum nelumboides]|nr:hypothetical protein [Adiantum nelumboides]